MLVYTKNEGGEIVACSRQDEEGRIVEVLWEKDWSEILDKFYTLGNNASYYYADDNCKEWGLAKQLEKQAVGLYNDHPELREQMERIAKEFLWSLKSSIYFKEN